MKWMWLLTSIVCEVIGTTFLKLASDGGKNAWAYATAMAVFYAVCFGFLAVAMKHFSISSVYATWSGLGVCLLALVGVIFFGDEINSLKLVSFALVIAGIVGLNMSGMSH